MHVFEMLFLRHQLLANIRAIHLGYRGFLPDPARPALFLQKSKHRRNMNSIYLRRNGSVTTHTSPSNYVRSFCVLYMIPLVKEGFTDLIPHPSVLPVPQSGFSILPHGLHWNVPWGVHEIYEWDYVR